MIVPTGTRTRTPGVYVQLLDRRFMSNSYLEKNSNPSFKIHIQKSSARNLKPESSNRVFYWLAENLSTINRFRAGTGGYSVILKIEK